MHTAGQDKNAREECSNRSMRACQVMTPRSSCTMKAMKAMQHVSVREDRHGAPPPESIVLGARTPLKQRCGGVACSVKGEKATLHVSVQGGRPESAPAESRLIQLLLVVHLHGQEGDAACVSPRGQSRERQ